MLKSFKFIAIRIFESCDSNIRKCLQPNRFYYFCNDYVIKQGGKSIENANKYEKPLSNDFFSLDRNECKLNINLQAVVGKNGDGKSSLVEIALRLINNFAISKHIYSDHKLTAANNVKAELFYTKDGDFFCLSNKNDELEKMTLWKYVSNAESTIYTRKSEVPAEDLKENFFYTLVSNYSHYAYNTSEYQSESSGIHDYDCWLYNIFNKNDGYQVPLSLHPYRKKGNIDINRERELTKPRLVSTLVRLMLSAEHNNNQYEINGKTLAGLKLTDIGYSKFQEYTLKAFFKDNRDTSLLQKEIETLRNMNDIPEDKDSNDKIVNGYINALKSAGKKYFKHEDNKKLYNEIKRWACENDLCDAETDVSIFIELLKERVGSIDIIKEWEQYDCFNLCQIQRIELIDDICDQWNSPGLMIDSGTFIKFKISPEILMKPYRLLNDREKCLHYMIYKTISIFETYESYEMPCYKYENTPLYFGDTKIEPGMTKAIIDGVSISKPFAKLSKDWQMESHITLKLRQTYNFFQQGTNCTYTLYPPKSQYDKSNDNILFFANMSEANRHRLSKQDQLPPAIYHWDLAFWADGNIVYLETFSSGEKQKLFSLSAITYHLQNLNSVATEKFHYHSINIILEEIELYFHPEWQRTFCYDLIKMIRDAGLEKISAINILFVTHSPYILSDIPKSNVLFLKDGLPENSMQENTFGANINSLLKNGFFMPSLPIGKFAYEKINQLFGMLHSGEFNPEKLKNIRSEIQMVGEPYIRQQLMTLLKMYSLIDENEIKEYLRQIAFEMKRQND